MAPLLDGSFKLPAASASISSSGISSSTSAPFSGSHITDGRNIPRQKIGPAASHLLKEMQTLYWQGVKRELSGIILTLRAWQLRAGFADTILDDERPDSIIHGYETFMDQVTQSSRAFAERNSPPDEDDYINTGLASVHEDYHAPKNTSYTEALRLQGLDYYAQLRSKHLKDAVKENIGLSQPLDLVHRRAKMLLQSAQFMDIDKLIEYREPEKLLSFWKRPAPPQLTVLSYDRKEMPVFQPQECSQCRCIIRGSSYEDVKAANVRVCESCYRKFFYGKSTITKKYKKCCLPDVITADVSQKICHCPNLQRRDEDGKRQALWPLGENSSGAVHYHGGPGRANCGLYDLNDMVAEAKYAGTRGKADWETPTLDAARKDDETYMMKLKAGFLKHGAAFYQTNPMPQARPRKLPNLNGSESISEFGTSYGHTDYGEESVPRYLRSITDKYPYGNVHMALRFGPLCIENGVSNTHGGVLITSREPPELQVLRDQPKDIERSLLLTGREERSVYAQNRPRSPKRYKAIMKQIVGGAFSGFLDNSAELQIIEALVAESSNLISEGVSASEKSKHLDNAADRLLSKVYSYLTQRVDIYLKSIAARLLDTEVELRWNFQTNNCQTFCDNLIDRDYFGAMFATTGNDANTGASDKSAPLYLISFVCRPAAYVQEKVRSKYDVANGLMEEYLLKFRHGRHDEADVIDTLHEYWHDWGNFEGPIYPYQDVFPWDCTEAYCRSHVKCSECNLSKHVWAFPFDSWSISTLHLTRGRQFYPRGKAIIKTAGDIIHRDAGASVSTGLMTDQDWFYNRLTILLAQDALLTGAVAMAKCTMFRKATDWIHQQDEQTRDRLKLGGIHRAQPFSHHFERGAYHQFYVAGWASLRLPLRIQAYEHIRDWRATRKDVKDSRKEYTDTAPKNGRNPGASGNNTVCGGVGGGEGCTAVACAAEGAGCAGGDTGPCVDTCGTGCGSACGGGGGGGGGGCGGGGGGCGGGGGGGGGGGSSG